VPRTQLGESTAIKRTGGNGDGKERREGETEGRERKERKVEKRNVPSS